MTSKEEKYKINVEKTGNKFKEFFLKDGYKLIGFSIFILENTFIFETADEAAKAYKEFEKDKKQIFGWWYGRKDFANALLHFEKKYWDVDVIWFDQPAVTPLSDKEDKGNG